MEGILKKKEGHKASEPKALVSTLSLPSGEEEWQVHSFAREGGTPSPASVSRSRLPKGTLVALPASHCLVLPLWLQTTDRNLLHGLVLNQLERLRPFAEEHVEWAYLPVAAEADRTLVAVYLLPPALPERLLVPQASGYDFTVRCQPLPDRGSVLVREAGGITLLCAREGALAYAHHFPGSDRVAEISPDLAGTARWLVMEQVADPRPCLLRGSFDAADRAAAAALFGDASLEASLPPRFPQPSFALLPPSLRTARQSEAARLRRRRFLQFGALFYVLLLAGAATHLFLLWKQVDRLEGAQTLQAPAVARLKKAAGRWEGLRPAVDPDLYPLQALLAVVGAMPAEIRLTQFGETPGKILLAGEGKNAAVIFSFSQSVQKDPLLGQWAWTMPQPQILPNNRAQFQMEGVRKDLPVPRKEAAR